MDIPSNIMEQVKENDRKRIVAGEENVLFLVMSTLYQEPKINTYQIKYNDKIWHFKGISQLEAHTKYVISLLESKGKRLHRIVILQSDATTQSESEKWYGESAVTFYKKRINEYTGNHKKGIFCDNLNDENILLKEHSIRPYEKYISFHDVSMSSDTYLWDAVSKIKSKKDNLVNLYMDMQGGDRNSLMKMNAVVELLGDQNIKICGRYANDYSPKKSLHTIREVSEEYRTYDLITAMEVFKKYGWGKELEDYFKGEEETSRNRRLISAIKDASDSISLCDVEKFDNSIKTIQSLEGEFASDKSSKTQLDLVYEDIRRDYEPLINSKYAYVAQIEWCLKKNFIQQAITIFESKMPCEYIRSGLMYYMTKNDLNNKDHFFQDCLNEYREFKNYEKYKINDINHYIVKNNNRLHFLDKYVKYGTKEKDVIVSIRAYKKLCNIRNSVNHVGGSVINEGGVAEFLRSQDPKNKCWQPRNQVNIVDEMTHFLENWKRLADKVPKNVRENVIDLS